MSDHRAGIGAADLGRPQKNGAALLAEFTFPSEAGNERVAMESVAGAVQALGLSSRTLSRLATAVGEAAMNAIEHGNQNRADVPFRIRVLASAADLRVQIADLGGDLPLPEPEAPDLAAKLAGRQRARGWGLFLIKTMVDEIHVTRDGAVRIVELMFHLKGDGNATAGA